jgi:flagellar motor switch protein FliM
MGGNYGIINNEFAKKIVHEYNVFMKETRKKMDETRRATMISLRKLLNLKDGDIIEIREDDTLRVIAEAEETANG